MQKCFITGITWILEMEEKGCYLPEKDYPCINKYTEAQLNTPKRMKNHATDVHTPEEKRVRYFFNSLPLERTVLNGILVESDFEIEATMYTK